ncbi:DUF1707 domain-containing protein [Mycolicibacterium flavescens]|uniref:DUF1707 domain-containing protein n=1 Tax=Mycolicibacterium flavescens TaxID=1776 RepID=A0A1E3RJM2_MYCFV|nr:DUF1707 domain-containing protein [Mycolicibacterium flavescens]MCV7280549.1 DUF1707 domain-containing protein [Mycolicibacterium flavescens]ODQ90063.1 hypothetical protein BHQ18_11470 [Mycolicibacterium flavescens]
MDCDDANLRVSDGDRDHVRQQLERAVGQGMLTLEEFSERVDTALSARTRAELRQVVADLPETGLVATREEVLGGWMSSISRRGQWTVPSHIRLKTRLCSTTLDFTEAALQSPVVTVDIDDYLSSTELILPDDATVDLNGVDTFAADTTVKVSHGPRSPRLHVVVRGRVRFGSVTARHPFGRTWRRMLG